MLAETAPSVEELRLFYAIVSIHAGHVFCPYCGADQLDVDLSALYASKLIVPDARGNPKLTSAGESCIRFGVSMMQSYLRRAKEHEFARVQGKLLGWLLFWTLPVAGALELVLR